MSMPPQEDDLREYLQLANVPSCCVDDSDMTPELITYLVAFCSYASKRNSNRCWVKQRKVATRLGVTQQAVSAAAKRLEDLGYLHSDPEYSEIDGARLSNTYWIDKNFTVPPERDRSAQPRKRAGVGGKPTHKTTTQGVVPDTTQGVVNPTTQGVVSDTTQGVVAMNMERGIGNLRGKGKRTRAHACEAPSPTFNQWLQMPDSKVARAWTGGQPPKYSDQLEKYRRYCSDHGLAALS